MGIIAKQKTKKQVLPMTGPSGLPTSDDAPWTTHGKVLAGAKVRAAALSLDVRGRESSGMNQKLARIFYTIKTTLRVESVGSATWAITLGPYGKPEWRTEVAVLSERRVSIRTTRYATMEDQLINGDLHDAFKQRALESFGTGAVAGSEQESEISLLSLDCTLLTNAVEALGVLTDNFTVIVDKPVDQIASEIASVGFAPLNRGEGTSRWGLGLPAYWDENFIDLAIRNAFGSEAAADEASTRLVVGSIYLGASGSRSTQIFAAQAARAFVTAVKNTLMAQQEKASFTPPRVLTGPWSS
jgi:hypothetical protein